MGETLAGLPALYRQFVLRDIMGKILPGLVALLGAGAVIFDTDPIGLATGSGLHGAVVLALFALAWLVGFAVQTVLDLVKLLLLIAVWLLRSTARSHRLSGRARRMAAKKLLVPLAVWLRREGHLCIDTLRPRGDQWVRVVAWRTRLAPDRGGDDLERLAVIKEATGNLAIALVLFLVLISRAGSESVLKQPTAIVIGVVLTILLGIRHMDACKRELQLQAQLGDWRLQQVFD